MFFIGSAHCRVLRKGMISELYELRLPRLREPQINVVTRTNNRQQKRHENSVTRVPCNKGGSDVDHPFVGGDKGDGTDVSGNIKAAVRS